MRIHDTLTRKLVEVRPASGPLRFYSCGPTVHDYSHVGNARYYVFVDLFKRVALQRGIAVRHVMNVTDVEDKIIQRAQAAGIDVTDPARLPEYTRAYEDAFLDDLRALRTLPVDDMPHATAMVPEMIAFVERLVERGHAYESDGSVYFRIASFPAYGQLAKIDVAEMRQGARAEADEYDKEDVRDFVLWKASKEGEPRWDSPWGPGRPGWHLECSVMSLKCLGEGTIDVHAGGEDLVFPHHENEIAQSEGASGTPFCRIWMHCAHLRVDDRKMAKSLGNFHTLRDLVAKGFDPLAVRYLLSSTHYRAPINFTFDGIEAAAKAIQRLTEFGRLLAAPPPQPHGNDATDNAFIAHVDKARTEFDAALDDDLNTSGALGALFGAVREINAAIAAVTSTHVGLSPKCFDAAKDLLERANEIFAFLPEGGVSVSSIRSDVAGQPYEVTGVGHVPTDVLERVLARQVARKAKNFADADALRDELTAGGWIVEDVPGGARVKKA